MSDNRRGTELRPRGLTSLVQPGGAGGVLPGSPAAHVDAGLDVAVGAGLPTLPLHLHLLLGHQQPLLQPLVLQLQPPDLLVQLLHHLLHLHVPHAGHGAGPVPSCGAVRHQLLQPTSVLHQLHQLGGQPDRGRDVALQYKQTHNEDPIALWLGNRGISLQSSQLIRKGYSFR